MAKCTNLTHFKLCNLHETTAANKTLLLRFAAEVCTSSENKALKTIELWNTGSTKDDGYEFVETLAQDDEVDSLEEVTISNEANWFRGLSTAVEGEISILDHV